MTESLCVNDHARTTSIRHKQSCAMLVLGLQGSVEFSLPERNEIATVRENQTWFFAPGRQPLMRRHRSGEAASMFVVRLVLDSGRQDGDSLVDRVSGLRSKLQQLDGEPHLSESMRSFLLRPTDNPCDLMIKEGRCLELFGNVFRHVTGALDPLNAQESAIFHKCLNLLLDSPGDPPSLRQLASICDTNHVKLNRLFARKTGMTVFAFYRRLRLRRAASELQESTRSITEIAHAFGFSSSSHFTTAFAAEFGETPRQYRAAYRGRARAFES
ncbi:MAG: AraC family transcriptional regulator [Pseudomonadota bacterium]